MLKLPAYHDFAKQIFTENGFEFIVNSDTGNSSLKPDVDAKEVLSEIFKISGNHISEPLIEYASTQLQLDTFFPYVVRNYRGVNPNIMRRDVSLKFHKEIYRKLFFFLENQSSHHDAEREDISMYLYGKGCTADATDNLKDAVLYQLGMEKGKKISMHLDGYTKVRMDVIDFKDISDTKATYHNMISAMEPVSPFDDGLAICGVLAETETGYRMLDGKHRIKHEIMFGASTGTFIIIS